MRRGEKKKTLHKQTRERQRGTSANGVNKTKMGSDKCSERTLSK